MGNHSHGTASEWFAAGVTLHELLTGRRPFEATRLQAFRYTLPQALLAQASPTNNNNNNNNNQPQQELPPSFGLSRGHLARTNSLQNNNINNNNNVVSSGAFASSKSSNRTEAPLPVDTLWPEFLYSCDYLSEQCKDFVRTLLIPHVRLI